MIYVRSYDMSAQSKGSPCPAPLPLNSPQGFIQDVPLRGGDRGRGSNCRATQLELVSKLEEIGGRIAKQAFFLRDKRTI